MLKNCFCVNAPLLGTCCFLLQLLHHTALFLTKSLVFSNAVGLSDLLQALHKADHSEPDNRDALGTFQLQARQHECSVRDLTN